MRVQFYQNARNLKPNELLELRRMVKKDCPAALQPLSDKSGDKIDIDQLPMNAFLWMDM